MRKTLFVAALLTGGMATPAMAQDDTSRGGFHVGAIVGYDTVQGDVDGADGVTYGVTAGYDFEIGRNFYIGPEVELSTSSVDECESGINRAGDLLCLDAGRDIYVGARFGTRVGPNRDVFLYAGGGYTNAEFHATYDANLAGNTGDLDISEETDGFRLKAGVEWDFVRNAFVRAEYRYSNYDGDIDRHQAVAGVGLRF
ncbi:MAG: porin family protein [Allosphingosinicella sp.]|uniref:porin family protein n=1 Tax=Allosphingosinicella sp. TaxID=2823234 RepID=UPI00392B14EF